LGVYTKAALFPAVGIAPRQRAGYFASVALLVDENPVRRVRYDYVDSLGTYPLAGSAGDLRSAILEQWEGSQWRVVRQDAYRYYVDGESDGFVHGLKMVFSSQSVAAIREAGLIHGVRRTINWLRMQTTGIFSMRTNV